MSWACSFCYRKPRSQLYLFATLYAKHYRHDGPSGQSSTYSARHEAGEAAIYIWQLPLGSKVSTGSKCTASTQRMSVIIYTEISLFSHAESCSELRLVCGYRIAALSDAVEIVTEEVITSMLLPAYSTFNDCADEAPETQQVYSRLHILDVIGRQQHG